MTTVYCGDTHRPVSRIKMGEKLIVTVIPNWNLKAELGECLDSLYRVSYFPHRVIVVDNGSTDGSPEFVATKYPWVHLITLPDNRGYAAALNIGIAQAMEWEASYVLALNNDTVVTTGSLTRLAEVLNSDNTIGIAAPKVLYFHQLKRIFSLGDRIYRWLPLPVGFGYKWPDHPIFSRVLEFDYVTGCAMMIRTSIFEEVGLFDESFFLYYEDADFCRRVRERGYRIVCVGDAVIYHKASVSSSKNALYVQRIRARNRVRFYRRYRHGPHPWLTFAALAFIDSCRAISYFLRGKGYLVKPYLQGLWEGWHDPVV